MLSQQPILRTFHLFWKPTITNKVTHNKRFAFYVDFNLSTIAHKHVVILPAQSRWIQAYMFNSQTGTNVNGALYRAGLYRNNTSI